MNTRKIFGHIDHTILKPTSTWEEVEQICSDALKYNTASACIPPNYVERAHAKFPELNICTVIGFPLGYSMLAAKQLETNQALKDGANEIDMVINISDVKNKNWDDILQEIVALKEIIEDKILKVIIETDYLNDEEKIKLCEIITEAGADYIKTSTGFAQSGAKIEDILLFKKHLGPDVKIKAAGGVKTKEDLIMFLDAGCERIGTSGAVNMLKDEL